MKRLKTVLILGLIILAAAAALALAAEPAQPVLPLRARVLEILQQHPEVWEEIQALEDDYGPPAADDETDSSSGLWGLMMGRGHMRRHHGRYCRPENGNAPSHHMETRQLP